MFGPTNRCLDNLNIALEDERIEIVNYNKCLGVVIGNKLRFKYHIDILSALRQIHSSNISFLFY